MDIRKKENQEPYQQVQKKGSEKDQQEGDGSGLALLNQHRDILEDEESQKRIEKKFGSLSNYTIINDESNRQFIQDALECISKNGLDMIYINQNLPLKKIQNWVTKYHFTTQFGYSGISD